MAHENDTKFNFSFKKYILLENTMPINLHIDRSCFGTVVAELSSSKRDHRTHKAKYLLSDPLERKKLPIPSLQSQYDLSLRKGENWLKYWTLYQP